MAIAKVNIAAIGDPWSADIKYPTIKEFPSFPKNKKEIEARNKGVAAYRQTFSWLSNTFLAQPRLVLGYEMTSGYLNRVTDYTARPEYHKKWRRIAHQHSGLLCGHTYMYARVLTPTDEFLASMKTIVALNSRVSGFGPSLSQMVSYSDSLRTACPRLKLSCEDTFRDLNEAIYPLDLSETILKQICKDRLPSFKNWNKQFVSGTSFVDLFKSPSYMRLFIFSENSD